MAKRKHFHAFGSRGGRIATWNRWNHPCDLVDQSQFVLSVRNTEGWGVDNSTSDAKASFELWPSVVRVGIVFIV